MFKQIRTKAPVKSITIHKDVLTVGKLKQYLATCDDNMPIALYDRENGEYYSCEDISKGEAYVNFTTEYVSGTIRNGYDWHDAVRIG